MTTDPHPLHVLYQSVARLASIEATQAKAVADARSLGISWAEIAQVLGVTKQAAQQRFGVVDPAPANRSVVCYRCGREGERGFTQSSGNGDGTRDSWRCTNEAACAKREAVAAKKLGWD
jgi:hypothetical protein